MEVRIVGRYHFGLYGLRRSSGGGSKDGIVW